MRTGTRQKGKFNIQPGMAFIMSDMNEIIENGEEIDAYRHPWLITDIYDDYVEIVMSATLSSSIENKHKSDQLDFDENFDISSPCPPMDPNSTRTSYINMATFTTLPKKILFSHDLRILNENTKERNFSTEGLHSLCIDDKELAFIQNNINTYIQINSKFDYDPFECAKYATYKEDFDDGYTDDLPDGFSELLYDKKFGWKHLPDANPLAIYPFEDQMHDYEKTDPELIRIAERKSKPSRKPKCRHKIDSHLSSTYEELSHMTTDTDVDFTK